MTERQSLFPDLPLDVQDALSEARRMVEIWFGGGDPDKVAVRLDEKLDALQVPK